MYPERAETPETSSYNTTEQGKGVYPGQAGTPETSSYNTTEQGKGVCPEQAGTPETSSYNTQERPVSSGRVIQVKKYKDSNKGK